MSEIVSNKRIAKNSVYLYVRTLIVIVINLYASRVILATLGVEDYGIYNVVAGVVLMLGFLNNAMVASSMRFVAFEQGRSDVERQTVVYSTSVLIHITIAIVIILLSETIGLWFLNSRMNIANERLVAANWVYQSAIFTFVLKIVNTPNQASVIAHERMHVFALISIIDAFFQLGIIYILKIFDFDKLILYSILLLVVSLINLLIYKVYSLMQFKECHFHFSHNYALFKEMLSFAGWSFVGNMGFAMRGPGVNIIVNLFCGPAVNAARGIAYQVSSVVNNFVSNFQTAVNPQITKRYAAHEVESMMSLIKTSSKLSFFLLSIVLIPLYVRADYVLELWLEEVPNMTLQFLRGVLIMGLIHSMCDPFTTGIQATGNIKLFQIVIAFVMLLDLPLSYLLLKYGFAPYSVMYIAISTEFVALICRVLLLNREIKIDVKNIIVGIFINNIGVGVVMFMIPLFINQYIPQTFLGLIILCLISLGWDGLTILLLGLNKQERGVVFSFARKVLCKGKIK